MLFWPVENKYTNRQWMQHAMISPVKTPFDLVFNSKKLFDSYRLFCWYHIWYGFNLTNFHLTVRFNICLAFKSCIPSTCFQIWCYFSSEQLLHPTDTLWCSYIPGSLFFYLYPLRWAMSPRQPSLTTQTHRHSFSHQTHTYTRCELRLRWRLEGFINSVSDHMN